MEKSIKLKTADGHTIYGTLNTSERESNHLIVFVHGLTGHQNEHHFYNAARFFTGKGYDTFRFDLYSGLKGGRSLIDCTVDTHAQDLNKVLSHFRKKYKKISVVGHSLGGPTIALADTSLMDAIILWDPSHMPSLDDVNEGLERPLVYVKQLKAYLFDWGPTYLLGESMAKQFGTLEPEKKMRDIHVPVKIICAQKGNVVGGRAYLRYANDPKYFVVIKNAGHLFDEGDTEKELFAETLKWVKKF